MTTQEILSQQTTKTRKIQQLLQLGFTRKEVAGMMAVGYGFVQNVYAAMQRNGMSATAAPDFNLASVIFNRTFGVEFEAYGVSQSKLKRALEQEGIAIEVESYNHTTRGHWKIVTDASISGSQGFEVVSPVLTGEAGLEQVKKVCRALKACNALINKSCGMHIHFGASDFSLTQWKNLYKNYLNYEGLIDSFMPASRRACNNMYCKSIKSNFATEAAANAAIDACTSIEQISNKVATRSRYCKLNAESFFRHGTVEFRQHSGTIEFSKVENWVRFLNNLIEFSKTNVSTNKDLDSIKVFAPENVVSFFHNRISELAA